MGILDEKIAIITGGTGALGGVVVAALLQAGASVVTPYRKDGELEQLREHAGIAADAKLSGMVLDLTESLWQTQLDLNLKTTVLSCKAAVPHMLARGGGAIVNVGTRTATQPGANLAAYAASKRAVIQLTEALAAELRDHRITANIIMPSTIDTPANRKGDPTAGGGRWVKPDEIARVILFLAGPDARIISGATIPVYGRA